MLRTRQVMSPNRVTPRLRDPSPVADEEGDSGQQSEAGVNNGDSSDDDSEVSAASSSSTSSSSSSSSSGDSDSEDSVSSERPRRKSSRSKKKKDSKRKRSSKRKSSRHKRSRSARHDGPSLEVPKLSGADDYELWRTMIELKLKVMKLWSLVAQDDVCQASWPSAKKERWEERWLKAQAVIAGSLGPRLAGRYKRLLLKCNPVELFQEIEREYNAGSAAKNDILIKAAMFARKLVKGERVDTFIDEIMKLQEDLVTLGYAIDDSELARLLLTNSLEVFPDLSNELVAARMKGEVLEVGKVRGRLLAREQEESMRGSGPKVARGEQNPAPAQREQTAVFQFSSGQYNGNGGGRKNGGGHRSNHGSFKPPRRNSLQEAMQRKPCSNCGKLGHWHRDCKQKDKGAHGHSGSSGNGGSQPRHGGSSGRRHASPGPSALMATVQGAHNQVKSDVVEWCLDSAATINVCNDLTCFSEVATVSDGPTMSCASGSLVSLNQVGSVELCIVNELTGQQEKRLLSDVYYLPDAPANLLSQDYMQTELKYFVKMPGDQSTCILSKPGMQIKFVKVNGLYRLWSARRQQTQHPVVFSALTNRTGDVPLAVWHKRFAHASEATILEMTRKSIVQGLQVNREGAGCTASCLPCIHGKRVRMSYNERVRHAEKPLQRLQVDVCTVNELSVDGSISFLLVVDEFSRYKWIFLLRHKSEAKKHLIPLINRLHNKFRAKKWRVEEIHSDQGGEFDNNSIRDFSDKEGIELTQTNGYTPQENGIVERANGIVLPKVRALLHMTNMPDLLWGEAAQHVVYTLNVTATRALNGLTPHEKLSGDKPDVSCLRTWGCLCYYHIPSGSRSKKKKLSSRMAASILIGYSPATHGYKVLDLSTGAGSTHRGGNLIFAEDYTVGRLYVEQLLSNAYQHGDHALPPRAPLVPMLMQIEDVVKLDSVNESVLVQPAPISDTALVPDSACSTPSAANVEVNGAARSAVSSQSHAVADSDTVRRHPVSRSGRKRKRSSRLDGCEVFCASNKLVKAWLAELKVPHRLHARDVPIPATYKQAIRSLLAAYWQAAMDEELESLRRHGVWQVVERRAAGTSGVISNKWVFSVKKDEHGYVKRFKARLVIHGFKQRFGVNYNETFAPVIRFDTIRLAIYFAVQRKWSILQYDVKTAFLHGKLSEVVFMKLPQGCGSPGNQQICRLIKSLYGWKQAPHVWNKTLHSHLVALGFTRVESDHGLYALHEKGEIVMLLTVYVDDLLLMGENFRCEDVARKLAVSFELVELGPVKYLLGVEVSIDWDKRRVFYSQTSYIEEVLRRFHMHECHGSATPEAITAEPDAGGDAEAEVADAPYREIIGALQYLVSGSRPDIAHVVRRLGQFLSCFTAVHFGQAKRVLRYLQSTKHYGLSMVVEDPGEAKLVWLEAYSDADYANDKADRQSVSGYVTMINGSVISYGSRKQGLNAQSTMEAEYIAMNEGARDVMWLSGLCDELKWKYSTPTLWCDNTAAIALSKKPGKHNGSKHIENRFHYVRNLEDREKLSVKHCGTEHMIADILTKPLARIKFQYFRSLLGVVPRDEQGGAEDEIKQPAEAATAWVMIKVTSGVRECLA